MSSFYKLVDKYYSDQMDIIGKYIDLNKEYKFEFTVDNTNNDIVELYYDNKLILKAKYCFIGVYNLINSVWFWAWNIDMLNKKLGQKSKIIKNLKKDLINNYNNYLSTEADELYFYSSNGNFYVSHENVIKLTKMMIYLAKGLWFFTICHNKNSNISGNCIYEKNADETETIRRLEYIMITEILQTSI